MAEENEPKGLPGVGADSEGNPVVDPTKNVLDLVQAAIKRQDDLRDAGNRRHDDLRALNVTRLNELREAETRRIGELAAQKLMFDLEIAKILRTNQDAASTLLATQLKEVKNDLSDRTAKLEQFRWESGGKYAGAGALGGFIVGGLGLLLAIGTFFSLYFKH